MMKEGSNHLWVELGRERDRLAAARSALTACGEVAASLRNENDELRAEVERLERARDEWRSDFRALQRALVGNSGLSAMTEAIRLRRLHPLSEHPDPSIARASTGENE